MSEFPALAPTVYTVYYHFLHVHAKTLLPIYLSLSLFLLLSLSLSLALLETFLLAGIPAIPKERIIFAKQNLYHFSGQINKS